MTLEELADLLRTPLPGPPELTEDQLTKLRAARGKLEALLPSVLPSLPEQLPQAPQWLLDYGREQAGKPPPESPALRLRLSPFGAPVRD